MSLDELNLADLGLPVAATDDKPSTVTDAEIEADGGEDEEVIEQQDEGAEEDAGEPDPFAEYLEELEIDGAKYRVPEKIKHGFMRMDDYTRKSQANAETRKQLDTRATEIDERLKATDEELQARGAQFSIQAQLEEYSKVNWQEAHNQDYVKADMAWKHFQQLKDADQQIKGFLENAQKTRTESAERETANRLKATVEFAATKLKGWTPELDQKISDFAYNELGLDTEALKRVYTPQIYKGMYLAFLEHQTATARQNAPAKAATPPPKPMTTVSPKGSTVTKSVGQMSTAEMDAYLNKRKR